MKDNFSNYAQQYAQFRPTYPQAMYTFLLSHVKNKDTAWDCGTGNGQVAQVLAQHFNAVYATDMSANQLKNAPQKANLNYKVEQVENTNFPDGEFDLITVAQAIHWFNFDAFYLQVKRTLKPNGIFAVIGYGLLSINYEIDLIIQSFYTNILAEYWDDERKYLDENYETIPFPFDEIKTPQFTSSFNWTYHQLIGYLETWSAVQHYINKNEKNPIGIISKELKAAWGKQVAMPVNFKIILRLGTV